MNFIKMYLLFFIAFAVGILLHRPACSEEPQFRVSLGAEVLHAQGFSNIEVRYGDTWGVRVGRISAPMWMRDIKPEAREQLTRNFQLDSTMYYAVDREFCGERWCGTLGLMHIAELSKINGTHWNFLFGLRYKFTKQWSAELLHGSHASILGIQPDRANAGWNFAQLGRTF